MHAAAVSKFPPPSNAIYTWDQAPEITTVYQYITMWHQKRDRKPSHRANTQAKWAKSYMHLHYKGMHKGKCTFFTHRETQAVTFQLMKVQFMNNTFRPNFWFALNAEKYRSNSGAFPRLCRETETVPNEHLPHWQHLEWIQQPEWNWGHRHETDNTECERITLKASQCNWQHWQHSKWKS